MSDDFAEFLELAADLTGAPSEVAPFVKKALKGTAVGIKRDWRAGAKVSRGEGFSGAYPYSIDFDEKDAATGPEVEIGPDLGRNGGSAGFLEEAPGGVKAPPLHAGRNAVEAHEEDFVRGIEIALYDGLRAAIEKG